MATSSTKKIFNSSKDNTSNLDWTNDTNANSFLAEEKRLLSSERDPSKKPMTNQVSQKRLAKFCTGINQMTPEKLNEELQRRQLPASGDIEIRRFRIKQHYKCTLESSNPSRMVEQNFEYIAVVDFEATCDERQGNNYRQEIIEFPIVLINVQQQAIVDKFQSYCRPTIKPILSKFCTELTGIEQHQVDNAPSFVEVLHNVETWLNERNLLSSSNKRKLAFATDGPWDFANFLRMQCQFSSIPFPRWAQKWVNIRKEFANFYPIRRCGIGKMLEKLGLTFDGRQHSGLDDSINIARITIELLKDGCVLSFNDSICADDSKFAAITGDKKEVNEDDGQIVFKD